MRNFNVLITIIATISKKCFFYLIILLICNSIILIDWQVIVYMWMCWLFIGDYIYKRKLRKLRLKKKKIGYFRKKWLKLKTRFKKSKPRRIKKKVSTRKGEYYDIWEVQISEIRNEYLKYYKYIWASWHELEMRVIWLIGLRIISFGI